MERRLAAILAADVAGYSRRMERDEVGALAALNARRSEILQPAFDRYQGRIVKLMGDGVLVEFASAVNAVACAVEIQAAMAGANAGLAEDQRIILRIGINLGDVMVEGSDLYGDGVNIAARLEALAEPGGLCISDDTYRQVRDKLDLAFEDAGERQLKNLSRPMRIFHLRPAVARPASPSGLVLPDKPSIAVLPFQNMSADVEQEYFADGMVEEIITALSRMRWLFVIARNSTFIYKGRAVDVKQVGRDLGVRYVLEGSVRKAGSRLRIAGQLIDAATGAHIWADRFEGDLKDVFDLQDQMTASVVGAIAPKLEQAEIERAKRKPTDSLDAYDYFLRGMAAVHLWNREANVEALRLFRRAIDLDPNYAAAYGMAARCYSQRKVSGWVTDRGREVAEAKRLARRAAELGKDDAIAICTAGIVLAYVGGELEDGDALIDRALVLNPNWAWAWLFSGWAKVWLGEPGAATERIERAMRLSPQDPQFFNMETAEAWAHFVAGRYAEARSWSQMALREQPNYVSALRVFAASSALTGRQSEAEATMAHLRQIDPDSRISNILDRDPLRRPADLARFAEGLRKAGLPE